MASVHQIVHVVRHLGARNLGGRESGVGAPNGPLTQVLRMIEFNAGSQPAARSAPNRQLASRFDAETGPRAYCGNFTRIRVLFGTLRNFHPGYSVTFGLMRKLNPYFCGVKFPHCGRCDLEIK